MKLILDIPALLALDTWAGRRQYRIRVVGETREKFRFEALEAIPMPGRRRLSPGMRGSAPKEAVSI